MSTLAGDTASVEQVSEDAWALGRGRASVRASGWPAVDGVGEGEDPLFPLPGAPSLSLPRNNRTLGQGQEVKFIFIVEATLTDISVPLSKGREHTDYITVPRAAQGRGGRAGRARGPRWWRSTFSGCAAPTFQAHGRI